MIGWLIGSLKLHARDWIVDCKHLFCTASVEGVTVSVPVSASVTVVTVPCGIAVNARVVVNLT